MYIENKQSLYYHSIFLHLRTFYTPDLLPLFSFTISLDLKWATFTLPYDIYFILKF